MQENKRFHLKCIMAFGVPLSIMCNTSLQAQVGIGTQNPNTQAALEVSSENKGILIPRMPKANRPANAPAGLMIYQSDNVSGFYFFTGTKWQRMYAVDDTMPALINPLPGATNDPPATSGATGTVTGADGILYKTVRLGDGSVWLQQNLGSSRVATAIDDTQSFGDLYQWGRWADGHEKRTPVFSRTISPTEPNPNNPSGLVKQWGANVNPYYYNNSSPTWWSVDVIGTTDTWTASLPSQANENQGCDPCRLLLGGTWRLPTSSEYEGLNNNASTTGVAITNSTSGFNSWLKYSSGGRRDVTSTTLLEVGTAAYYWTSTATLTSSISSTNAYLISVKTSNANISPYMSNRGYGYSIRCKKD